ncbi:MAG: hypothetical protein IKM66_09325 [Clostridia bacterium]|nr:hypothetical protein [Clostridia bacterium]
MKNFIALLMIFAMLFAFAGCGEKKILRCDNCGADVQVDADSNMDDSWSIYCGTCNVKLGFDTLISEE